MDLFVSYSLWLNWLYIWVHHIHYNVHLFIIYLFICVLMHIKFDCRTTRIVMLYISIMFYVTKRFVYRHFMIWTSTSFESFLITFELKDLNIILLPHITYYVHMAKFRNTIDVYCDVLQYFLFITKHKTHKCQPCYANIRTSYAILNDKTYDACARASLIIIDFSSLYVISPTLSAELFYSVVSVSALKMQHNYNNINVACFLCNLHVILLLLCTCFHYLFYNVLWYSCLK